MGGFLFAFICSGSISQALETPSIRQQSSHARQKTILALQAMNQGQWNVAYELVAGARDPLASKIYYWMLFRSDKGEKDFVPLAQFVRGNPGWPGIEDLRLKAEKLMPDDLTNAELIAWFNDYPPRTPRGLDLYMRAMISSGRTEQAKTYLSKWWAEISMSRDDQRHIYKKYGMYLDMQAHRRRLDTLLFSGQYSNARAIAQVLGHGYPELAEARIALAEGKKNVNPLINKVPQNLQEDPGLMYERLRWRRMNNLDVEAMQILHNAPPASQIQNPDSWWKEQHILIRRLLEKKHYESAYLLASKHFQTEGLSYAQAEWLAGWLALRFLDKPTKAYQHFEALHAKVSTPLSKSRAAYWAGRASESFKQKELALRWYQEAAKYQTVFYGQLAGAKLGMENALPNAAPPVLTSIDISDFNARDLVQAARLFHAAGMTKEASRFLKTFVENEKSAKAYRFGAELAAELQRYHDAIQIAKDATSEGLFLTAQSYPVITGRLKNVDTEWALVHALIRQESMFDPYAQSPAGALGLMQLMPATANEVARKKGVTYSQQNLTYSPDYNISLGTHYLDTMLSRFDGSYPLAIAAYNAGPGRVDSWLKIFGDPRTGEIELIDWIEMIPVYETRNYVQRVMEGVYVYRLRLAGIQKKPDSAIHIAMSEPY